MATVDTLLVRIEADMTQLKRQLADVKSQTDKTSKGMVKAFGNVRKAIALVVGAVVIRQLSRLGMGLLNLAGDAAEMQSMSEAVFGQYVGDIRKFAQETALATGRSRFELEEMAATVQDTFVPLGFARGVAADMSKALVTLSVDVGSFKNAADTDVMNSFTSALVGNHEAVRRFGIVITEAELQAELFRMGIKKSKDEVTAAEKVQARFNLILAGTKDAQGDAARTADSYANRVKALQGTWRDLGTELGRVLIGPATFVIDKLLAAAQATRELLQVLGLIDTAPAEKIAEIRGSIENYEEKVRQLLLVQQKLNQSLTINGQVNPIVARQLEENIGVINNYKSAISNLKEELAGLVVEQASAASEAAKAAGETPKAETVTKKYTDTIDGLKNQVHDLKLEYAGLSEEQVKLLRNAGAIGDVSIIPSRSGADGEEIVAAGDRAQALFDVLRQRNELQAQINEREEASKAILEEKNRAVESAKNAVEALQTEEQKLLLVQQDLNVALKEGEISQKEFEAASQATKQAIFEQSEVGQVVMSTIGQVSQTVSQGIADVITNSGEGLKSFKEMFRGIVNSIIKQLIEMKIQAIITSQALSFLGGGGGGGGFSLGSIVSGIGSIFGGGGGASTLTAPSNSAINLTGGLRTAATGSSAAAGQSFLVGERGPEIFTPRASGMIAPNNMVNMAMSGGQRLNGGAGGPNITQNFNVTTGVVQTVRAEILNMMPLIKQESVNAVVDARQRGGSVAAGLGA